MMMEAENKEMEIKDGRPDKKKDAVPKRDRKSVV